MTTPPKNYYIRRLRNKESTEQSANMMNTPKTTTKTTTNNKKHGWAAETFVQIVDSCTHTDPIPKVCKLVSYYERLAWLDNLVS